MAALECAIGLNYLSRSKSRGFKNTIPVLKMTNSRSSFEKSRKFPFIINDLFTSKHVHYCQKVAETDSFLSTAQNLIVIIIAFNLQYKATRWKPSWFPSYSFTIVN